MLLKCGTSYNFNSKRLVRQRGLNLSSDRVEFVDNLQKKSYKTEESTNEATLYVKGFLNKSDDPRDFKDWFYSHKMICEDQSRTIQWNSKKMGFKWQCGERSTFMPYSSMLLGATHVLKLARITSLGISLGLVGDAAIYVASMLREFYVVRRDLERFGAEKLAAELAYLSKKHERVRIVGHSLGCLLVLKAVSLLDLESRPNEIHLCAPAFFEHEVEWNVSTCAKENLFIYHCPNDLVLNTVFKFYYNDGDAVGCVGLKKTYQNVTCYNVSDSFEIYIHSQYPKVFHNFAR